MAASTDSTTRLIKQAMTALRHMSGQPDPAAVIRQFREDARHFFPFDRTLSLSRRGLERPNYRITHSDLWPDEGDVWRKPHAIPVLQNGLLSDLIWSGVPAIHTNLEVRTDDPAIEHLAGMRCLVALPHFDEGEAVNMVVHLWNDPAAFDVARFPDLLLISGLFGRAIKGLVVTRELRETQQSLAAHNRIMGELGDVVIEQARELKLHAAALEARVRERTAQLDEAYDDAVFMLALASEQKDHATGDHVRRVESLTAKLARAIGFEASEAASIGRAAILHDVGKLHIPDAILQKPEPLSDEERAIMQEHAQAGERILGDRPAFAVARRIARSHHEDWSGRGYPDGLAGEAIPIEARIVHVVDVYDALVNARPYKNAWKPEKAIEHMAGQAGVMFDPKVLTAFRRMLAEV